MNIGITERGDAGLDHSWLDYKGPKILITKAPHKLPFKKMDPKTTIIHCTITGMGASVIEPQVIHTDEALEWYKKISSKFYTVLRIDPIIPRDEWVAAALYVFSKANGRVRISFLDAYPHVRDRLESVLPGIIYWQGIHAPLGDRLKYTRLFKNAEVCGEPGLGCIGCVSAIDCTYFGIQPLQNTETGIQRSACRCLSIKKELLNSRNRCKHKCLYCYWKD